MCRYIALARLLATGSLPLAAACSSDPSTIVTVPPPPSVARFAVKGLPSPSVAGSFENVEVIAEDAAGHDTITSYGGTVRFTSTDPAAKLPSDYTFVPTDSGRHAFTVILETPGLYSVTATDEATSSITGADTVQVTTPPAHSPALFVATLGNGVPGYPGQIVSASLSALSAGWTDTLGGSNTQLSNPDGIAHDASGQLFVALPLPGPNKILVFPPGAKGNVAPSATIEAPPDALAGGIAVDESGKLYVVGRSSINVYAAGASGNAAPIAVIAGTNTALGSGLGWPYAVAVDRSGTIYVANYWTAAYPGGAITIYAPGANGNVAPVATIGGNNTYLTYPFGVAVDSAGNIYVSNVLTGHYSSYVTVYAKGANGNVSPMRTIRQPNRPYGVVVDAAGNLFVANGGRYVQAVLVFRPGSDVPTDSLPLGAGPAAISF